MNSSINTYDDFLKEKERLKQQLELQRKRIDDNWKALKVELEPVSNTLNMVGKLTKGDKNNPLINIGLGLASDLLLKKFLFARAGWALKIGLPFLMKNFSSHLIADKGKSLIQKIGRILRKKGSSEERFPSEEKAFNSFVSDIDQNKPVNDSL